MSCLQCHPLFVPNMLLATQVPPPCPRVIHVPYMYVVLYVDLYVDLYMEAVLL